MDFFDSIKSIATKYGEIILPDSFEKLNNDAVFINPNNNNFTFNYVDSGFSMLLDTPSLIILFFRVALVNNKINTQEYYITLRKEKTENELLWNIFMWDKDKKFLGDFLISGSLSKDEVISYIRKKLEWESAYSIMNMNNNQVFVFDGSFDVRNNMEKLLLDKLYDFCKKNKIVLSAFSKTSSISTDTGLPATFYFNKKYENPYYVLIGRNKIFYNLNMYFSKLNRNSKYSFRVDLFIDNISEKDFFQSLMQESDDPVFIGYPYGLIKADSSARISNEEKDYERTKLFIESKSEDLLTELENSINAHSILDNLRF